MMAPFNIIITNNKYITFLISSISLILFILSIANVSIYQYPPDAFYYFNSLPVVYWIGLSLLIGNIIFLIIRNIQTKLQLVPILLIALYVYGFPNIIYEYPRYMDIYDHGADFVNIVKTGYIDPDKSYAREYPSLFTFTGILFILLNINIEFPFIFFKLFNILSLLFIIVLIYSFTAKIIRKYNNAALIGPFAFMALNWTPIGHFAPHTYSLIFYILFFISLIYILNTNNKRWGIISILLLFVINITNPTNATILFLNLVLIALFSFFISTYLYKNILYKRLSLIAVLMLVIWVGWTTFSEDVSLRNANRYINNLIEGIGDLSKVQLPLSPNESFALANKMRIAQTAFVSILLITTSFLIIKKRILDNNILILSGLVSISAFIFLIMFASDVLLTRMHVYLTLPLAIIAAYLVSRSIITKNIKLIFVITIAGWLYITHITLYASEPHTYLNASLLYIERLLNEHFHQQGTMHAFSVANFGSFYFDAIDKDNLVHHQYAQRYLNNYYITKDINEISAKRFVTDKINFILFSDVDENRLIMRANDDEFYDILQHDLNVKRFNLIINVSTSKIYIKQLAE